MIHSRRTLRLVLTAGLLGLPTAAAAFSQIDPGDGGERASKEGIIAVPLPPLPEATTVQGQATVPAAPAPDPSVLDPSTVPDPMEPAPPAPVTAAPETPVDEADDMTGSVEDGLNSAPSAPSSAPANIVRYGDDALPAPVRDLRARLISIAEAGDIEALRPFIETGQEPTVLSFGGVPADPIAYLKEISGDGEGMELLAILVEILESGYAHESEGTDEEIFIWPYFAQASLADLTPQQRVELFEIVTAGDFEAMQGFGAYNFYRVGISPEGRLEFFVAGD